MARRSSAVYPVTHLPLLHNPLLNAIFNHPNPQKSRLNKITKLLSDHPSQFILLLPDAISLIPFLESCHDEELVQSHIVQEVSQNTFESLNSRTYTVSKNYIMLTGTDLKVKMIDNELFQNFNKYMTGKSLYKVIHIETPLVVRPDFEIPLIPEETSTTEVDFNQLIREFPLVSERIGEVYRGFFTRLNLKEIDSLDKLVDSYNSIITSGSSIFADNLDKASVTSIIAKYPNLDINKSLFNYIEMNIYDKFWGQLCHLNQKNDAFINENYELLSHISLNQVENPEYRNMSMDNLTALEKSLNSAVAELENLNFIDTSEQQCKSLMNVFHILTSNTQMGADTLVGLLIVTICRSGVANLDSHLKYIKLFSYDNANLEKGHLGYVLSTFTAVIDYLNDADNLSVLMNHSINNQRVWSLFNEPLDHVNTVAELQDLLMVSLRDNVAIENSVYSRNKEGYSLLSLAIRSNNYKVFKTIIDYETIYPIEDILKDRNINNVTLLGQAILVDNQDMINELFSILISSVTGSEMCAYLNQPDDNHRTIGHILFDIELLKEVGPFINWKQRDINSQTPFFAVLRCYDHPQYDELVTTVIELVKSWYHRNNLRFDYRDHNDSKNNTLLHAIKSNLSLLLNSFENLNLNELNFKNLTPLMYYIKYNRTNNVSDILKDTRLDITKLDKQYYLSALDYAKVDIKMLIARHERSSSKVNGKHKNEVTNRVGNHVVKDDKDNRVIEASVDEYFIKSNFPLVGNKTFGITRIKSDNVNNDLCLFFKTLIIDDDGTERWITNIHNLKDYMKLLQILKVENPQALVTTDYIGAIPILPIQSLKLNNFYKYQSQKLMILLNLLNKAVLVDFAGSETLNDFLVKPGNLKEVEALNNIDQSSKMDKISEKPLDAEYVEDQVTAMKHFLNYSLEQLSELSKIFDNFIKMLVFTNIKFGEINYVMANFYRNFEVDTSIIPQNGLDLVSNIVKMRNESPEAASGFKFVAGFKLVFFMCEELIDIIKKTLATKAMRWDDANRSLTRIDNEIHRLHSIDGKTSPEKPKLSKRSSNLVLSAIENGEQSPDASSLATSDTTSTTSSSFIFTSIIQTKKSRDLKIEKLMERRAASTQMLGLIGNELKRDHELIALRLNNFLKFKKDFIRAQFKAYAEENITDLKFKLKLMEASGGGTNRVLS